MNFKLKVIYISRGPKCSHPKVNISRRYLRVFDPECIVPKVCSLYVVAERSERTFGFYPPLSQKVTERKKTSLDMGYMGGKVKGRSFLELFQEGWG